MDSELNNSKMIPFYIALIGVIIAISIFQFCVHGISLGDPVNLWIVLFLYVVYSLCSWQDKKVFFKRCVLALPFVLAAVALLRLTVLGNASSCGGGIILFICLTREIKGDLKRHYAITLTIAAIGIVLVILLRGFKLDALPYIVFIAIGVVGVIQVFYESYCNLASRSEESLELGTIAVKSLKVTGTVLLFFILFLIADKLCKYYHVNFWVSFGISVLIALSLLWFCRVFNIKNPAFSDCLKTVENKPIHSDECEVCGKTGLTQELLFKIDSGQRVCASCLKIMEQSR